MLGPTLCCLCEPVVQSTVQAQLHPTAGCSFAMNIVGYRSNRLDGYNTPDDAQACLYAVLHARMQGRYVRLPKDVPDPPKG